MIINGRSMVECINLQLRELTEVKISTDSERFSTGAMGSYAKHFYMPTGDVWVCLETEL